VAHPVMAGMNADASGGEPTIPVHSARTEACPYRVDAAGRVRSVRAAMG
jgi:hypothetical protein